jgi:3-deoxy-D-manno-octulosonic-acid transferase
MWLVYQLAFGAVLLLASPVLLARKGRHYLATLRGRLGGQLEGTSGRGGLWLHAVSVGEAGVAATLARRLPAELPLVVTTVTPTGQERAQAAFARRPGSAVAYLPFDLGFAIQRFWRRFTPRALVLVEGDLWPLVLRTAKRARLPIAVVNGRVSDRGYARMRRLRPLLRPLLGQVDRFGVQTGADRERLLALGVPAERVVVTGNLKYETLEPKTDPALEEALRGLAGGRPILLAGSTMPGEEELVLAAFEALERELPAMLILAPRHPERFPAVADTLAARGLAWRRRTALGAAAGPPAVVLLDSLGELAGLYRVADAAFVGGTLVPTGGHNPLEPARYGVPTAVGPAMHNFREMAEQFDAAGAWRRVDDPPALTAAWREWLLEPDSGRAVGARAKALLAAERGALDRTLAMLEPLLANLHPAVAEVAR